MQEQTMRFTVYNTCINHPVSGDLLRPGDEFDATHSQVARWTDPQWLATWGFPFVVVPAMPAPVSAEPSSPAEPAAGVVVESAPVATAEETELPEDPPAFALPDDFDELDHAAVKEIAKELGIAVGPRSTSADKVRARIRSFMAAE